MRDRDREREIERENDREKECDKKRGKNRERIRLWLSFFWQFTQAWIDKRVEASTGCVMISAWKAK